ncbi:aldehyde dehydrogenase family protein [Micromonospora sp. NBC_01813]|uniref:aldehyde dehydrogenase family protein n=1 Tax=Micromonospora sp. NBC_01813 TaxID=2975988 RepID=UPI002DD8BC6F|nr:aldehyde dehydrogenase family protein [Micromonospora sp. NBC_01813]WSA10054.1 aldehyde dehydrogenase family protein [Micromonospora sp. NBC_01813]
MTIHELSSPVTGDAIGGWRESGAAGVAAAVTVAAAALPRLAELSRWQRCDLLLATARALAARRDEVVADLLVEHGKVRAEAEAELDTAIHALETTAEYARRLDGSMPAMSDPAKRVLVDRIPLGVVGVITPWNFPINIPLEYLAPALAMGNSVVWKGAESTPRSSAHIAAVLAEAGWPEGCVVAVEGGPETGAALAAHQGLAAVGFTGSTVVGHQIARIGGMRKLLLELGGNGPTVVFADADPQQVAEAVVTAATFCSGQSCAATERVLVQQSHYPQVLDAIVAVAAGRTVGAPDDPTAAFGPLHLAQTARTMRDHLADATARGARLAIGGAPLADAPTDRYWPLSVLDRVDAASLVFTEETFGPIVPLTPFRDESELGDLIDAGGYGLNGAVFTADLDRAFRVAQALPCGSVVINDHSNVWETHLPFGGHPGRGSGIGRVGAPYALQELSTLRSTILHLGGVGHG